MNSIEFRSTISFTSEISEESEAHSTAILAGSSEISLLVDNLAVPSKSSLLCTPFLGKNIHRYVTLRKP